MRGRFAAMPVGTVDAHRLATEDLAAKCLLALGLRDHAGDAADAPAKDHVVAAQPKRWRVQSEVVVVRRREHGNALIAPGERRHEPGVQRRWRAGSRCRRRPGASQPRQLVTRGCRKRNARQSGIRLVHLQQPYAVEHFAFALAVVDGDHRHRIAAPRQLGGEQRLLHFGAADEADVAVAGEHRVRVGATKQMEGLPLLRFTGAAVTAAVCCIRDNNSALDTAGSMR